MAQRLSDAEFQRLNEEFEAESPQAVLRWAAENYGDKLALVTSFQPTGIVTLQMLHEMGIKLDVLTLDTGLLFAQTYRLMDRVQELFNLPIIRITPELTVAQQAEQHGPALWERDPDQCCNMRKVVPLEKALAPYDAWITGLRRDQGETRTATPFVLWDKRHQNIKLCPFATWTEEMVWTYIRAYELPYNELHERGYPSIGCWPCTQAVSGDSTDLRAGRWTNHSKIECGIHVPNQVGD